MESIVLHKKIIETLGGDHAVARLLHIKAPSVNAWKKKGIPRRRLFELAIYAERAGITNRKALFPDDWHLIWPELQ